MTDTLIPESVRSLGRLRGGGLVARTGVLLGPIIFCASVYAASGEVVRPLAIAIGLMTVVCVVHPDSHAGLVVVVLLGVQWLRAVDEQATPWLLGAVTGLALLHTCLAAATVAPPSARWSTAMTRRWVTRSCVLLATGAAAWAATALADGSRPSGNAVVITAALALSAAGGMWASASSSTQRRR